MKYFKYKKNNNVVYKIPEDYSWFELINTDDLDSEAIISIKYDHMSPEALRDIMKRSFIQIINPSEIFLYNL